MRQIFAPLQKVTISAIVLFNSSEMARLSSILFLFASNFPLVVCQLVSGNGICKPPNRQGIFVLYLNYASYEINTLFC